MLNGNLELGYATKAQDILGKLFMTEYSKGVLHGVLAGAGIAIVCVIVTLNFF